MQSNLLPLITIWKKIVSTGNDRYASKVEYATDKIHKYKVILKNGKSVSFGHKDYEDFLIHGDQKRRDNYRSRHRGDKINDPKASGFWSYHILW